MSLTFVMNTPPKNEIILLVLKSNCLILVDVAVWTELVGPALPLGGVWVAAVHVEGRGQQAETGDVAGGALDVDLGVDVTILHLTRVTLQVPSLNKMKTF